MTSPLSWKRQNLCWRSLAFIIDWWVVSNNQQLWIKWGENRQTCKWWKTMKEISESFGGAVFVIQKTFSHGPVFLTLAKVGHVGLCVVHEKVSRRKIVRIFLPVNQGRSSHYRKYFFSWLFHNRQKKHIHWKKAVTLVLNKGPLICPLWKLKVLPRETKQNEMVIIPT